MVLQNLDLTSEVLPRFLLKVHFTLEFLKNPYILMICYVYTIGEKNYNPLNSVAKNVYFKDNPESL